MSWKYYNNFTKLVTFFLSHLILHYSETIVIMKLLRKSDVAFSMETSVFPLSSKKYLYLVCCPRCVAPGLAQNLLDWIGSNFYKPLTLGQNRCANIFLDIFKVNPCQMSPFFFKLFSLFKKNELWALFKDIISKLGF